KTILITGGAGFIGSSIAERLARENEVILFDRFFHDQPVAFTSLERNPNVRRVEGDVLDAKAIAPWAEAANIVVHAAAIVGGRRVGATPSPNSPVNTSPRRITASRVFRRSPCARSMSLAHAVWGRTPS